jgi:hypothetical protein
MSRTDEENPGVQAGRSRDSSMDVEKLGRQRPEVFKSIWAELGFGFSVFCSMLMAVSSISHDHRSISHHCSMQTLTSSGILRQWISCYPSTISRRTQYPSCITNMAFKRLLPHHRSHASTYGPSKRYVWRIHCL